MVGFQLSFFIRMLFSCLVDSDRLDAEAAEDSEKAAFRGRYCELKEMGNILDKSLERKKKEAPSTPINQHRSDILDYCRVAADRPQGLFSLTVPTGGGKTLSSLDFALRHAFRHDLQRIVYVIPFTSIIEQNANVFRSILGDESVIEHHSNFVPNREDDNLRLLATENWDAPIIVTTNVQFFESLFSHKASRCRKLHNIANSVIILDEAQMLPLPFLRPCIEALRELSRNYKTSIVLCTATQPALKAEDGFKRGFENVYEIVPCPKSQIGRAHV